MSAASETLKIIIKEHRGAQTGRLIHGNIYIFTQFMTKPGTDAKNAILCRYELNLWPCDSGAAL